MTLPVKFLFSFLLKQNKTKHQFRLLIRILLLGVFKTGNKLSSNDLLCQLQ